MPKLVTGMFKGGNALCSGFLAGGNNPLSLIESLVIKFGGCFLIANQVMFFLAKFMCFVFVCQTDLFIKCFAKFIEDVEV